MKKIWNEQTKFEKILTISRLVVYAVLICASIIIIAVGCALLFNNILF